MDKVENSARKTGKDQFLVGFSVKKKTTKVGFRYIQQHNN